jgi:tagaturonate reductase
LNLYKFVWALLSFFALPKRKNNMQIDLKPASEQNSIHQEIALYPEKILQFGTGVLLKGLPDYFIQLANEAGRKAGRIVMVKSTSASESIQNTPPFTIYEKGIKFGESFERAQIVSSISRELNAISDWKSVLELAKSSDLEVIISNTTEAGIQYVEEPIKDIVPSSFPGKLIAVLLERYEAGLPGLVVIPCELIPDNGTILKGIVLKLAAFNQLGTDFLNWLETECSFCNSLVDRIVSGKPSADSRKEIESKLGYEDDALIETEPYALWAIECNPEVSKRLNWSGIRQDWILAEEITVYIERKLRILNGTHTIMVALGIIKGKETVLECMQDVEMQQFISKVALEEIAPATAVDSSISIPFANEVLDRFANPHIRHLLINITLQFSMKMAMRNLGTIERYEEIFGKPPVLMARGFAAFLHFLRPEKRNEKGQWIGILNGKEYFIQDDKAQIFHDYMQAQTPYSENIESILKEARLWGDFKFSHGFTAQVKRIYLEEFA